MSLSSKFANASAIIKQHGGFWKTMQMLYRVDDVKDGELIGTDRNGNRYYQNKRYFIGRSRWVIYNEKVGLDYDASQIAPEWHGWIHYTTDETPVTAKPIDYPWVDKKAFDNKTGKS